MPRPSNVVPVYRRHKPTNQAVCTVRTATGQRKDLYLGRWNSAESKTEFARIVAIVGTHGGIYPVENHDLTVNEALLRYVKYIESFYVDADGTPSRSVDNIKIALGYLRRLFGSTLLEAFGPAQFKAVRSVLIEKGLVRTQINKYGGIVRQFFRWAVEEQLVQSSVWETLRAVRSLAPGRSGAKEGKPRLPADPTAVEKAIPFMPPAIRVVVQLLRLTGARPTEMLTLRPCDLDCSSEIWRYTPTSHKTLWKGKPRVIYFGPEAQTVLAPWLLGTEHEAFVFSPARSEEMRSRERSKARQTPRWLSHMQRNEAKRVRNRKLQPRDRYNHIALSVAVRRACKRAGVKRFSPYELRHLRATELREKYGLEVVRATLGQSVLSMAAHYSRCADEILATKAAAEIG